MNSSTTSSDFLISAELLTSGGDSDDRSEGLMEYTGERIELEDAIGRTILNFRYRDAGIQLPTARVFR